MAKKKKKAKTSMSDQATAKGCLTLTLAIVGAGALIYVISLFVSNNPFPEFPQFIRRAPDGFHVEWPFGKSAVSKADVGENTGDESDVNNVGVDSDGGDPETNDAQNERDEGDLAVDGGGDSEADGGDSNPFSGGGVRADSNDSNISGYDELLDKHGELLTVVDAYQKGNMSAADLRALCDEYGAWFDGAIFRLNRNGAEAEREYRNILVAAAMSDQIAAAAIVKSLDEGDFSIFGDPASDYSRNINDAEDAYAYISGLQGDNPAR